MTDDEQAVFIKRDFSRDHPKQQVDEYANQILKQYSFYCPSKQSRIWIYDLKHGIWTDDGEENIEAYMRSELRGEEFSKHLIDEIETAVRYSSYDPNVTLGGCVDEIVLQNGTVNLTTLEFSPEFDPKGYHVAALPIAYDPNTTCPDFDRFLEQVIPNETDRQAVIEFFGYCLLKSYTYATVLLLVGSGANGKTVLLYILKSFLGPENVTSVTPQQIGDSHFASSHLYHKLANIAGDIPARPLKDTGTIKMLTGGDPIFAEYKHKDGFDFVNYSKQIFSANKVPETWDDTDAFYRRFRIIDMPNKFSPDQPGYVPGDKLKASLTTAKEVSGILNKALAGLKRLQEQGQLSGTQTTKTSRLDYMRRSDPVQYFFERFVTQGEGPSIDFPTFYGLFSSFSRSVLKKDAVSQEVFGKKVARFLPFVDITRPRPDEGGPRVRRLHGLVFDQLAYDKETGATL